MNAKASLGRTIVPRNVFEVIAIDLVGGFQASHGFSQICVAVDMLSRYAWAVPIRSRKAEDILTALEGKIFVNHGYPKALLSDNAGELTSKNFTDFLKERNIKHILTTPYNPQSNITERVIRSLLQCMRVLCENKPKNWAILVPYAVRAYNFSYHTSLGDTPYFNFYNRDPSGGYGCLISEQGESKTEAAIKAKYCAELARRQLLLSQDKRQKKGKVKSAVRYDIGDLVYLR